jgi:hypothetical protein
MTGWLLLFFPISATKNTHKIVIKKALLIQKCFFVFTDLFFYNGEVSGRFAFRLTRRYSVKSSEAI